MKYYFVNETPISIIKEFPSGISHRDLLRLLKNNPHMIMYIHNPPGTLVVKASGINIKCFQSYYCKQTSSIAKKVVRHNWRAFEYANPSLDNYRKLAYIACSGNLEAAEWIKDRKMRRKVMKKILLKKTDEEIIFMLKKKPLYLRYVKNQTHLMITTAIYEDYRSLKHVKTQLPIHVIQATGLNMEATKYIKNPKLKEQYMWHHMTCPYK